MSEQRDEQIEQLQLRVDELERALQQARRESSRRSELIRLLAHELRTPLSAILGWSQLAQARLRKGRDLEEPIRRIERNAKTQAQLIDDLVQCFEQRTDTAELNEPEGTPAQH